MPLAEVTQALEKIEFHSQSASFQGLPGTDAVWQPEHGGRERGGADGVTVHKAGAPEGAAIPRPSGQTGRGHKAEAPVPGS